MSFVNPVLRRELIAILETKKAYAFTSIYLVVSAVIVYLGWPENERVMRGSLIARHLFETFCLTQLAVLGAILPALTAPILTREKENESYDFLIATPLNKRALLMGKLSPSLVFVVLLLVGVFPMMSACTLLGGLPFSEVLAGNLILLCAALFFASLGCFFSAVFERTQAALAAAYMIVLPVSAGAAALLWNTGLLANFLVAPFVLFVTLFTCVVLLGSVIFILAHPRDPAPPIDREMMQYTVGLYLSRDMYPDKLFLPKELLAPRSDRMDILADKELRSEIFGRGTRWVRLAIQISVVLSVFILFLSLIKQNSAIFGWFLMTFIILLGGSLAAPIYSQERERKTLGTLLVTLVKPGRIMRAKYFVPLRITLILSTFLLVAALPSYVGISIGLYGGSKTALGFTVALLFILAVADLTISAGNYFSASSASTAIALIRTYAFLGFFFAGPLVLRWILVAMQEEWGFDVNVLDYVSPFRAFPSISISSQSNTIWGRSLLSSPNQLSNLMMMILGGLIFKALLWLRFQKLISKGDS